VRFAGALFAILFVACSPNTVRFPVSSALAGDEATGTPAVSSTSAPTQAAPAAGGVPTPSAPVVVSVPSSNVVWALVDGTRLYRSVDRGASWEQRGLPADQSFAELSFLDEREGWILTRGPAAAGCASQSFAVYHTDDRGGTWKRVSQGDRSDAMCKAGLTFADIQRGWIVLAAVNSPPTVVRTADSGETWQRSFSLPAPPGHRFGAESVNSAGRPHVFLGTLLVTSFATSNRDGAAYASTYLSNSNGATWVHIAVASEPNAPITFVTVDRWLTVGSTAQWRETTDRGRTWHEFSSDYKVATPGSPDIVFGDPLIGYAIFRGQIQRTTDGGAHWSAIKTPGT
jgi:photosystem II stability/assembly factor-like uncharacterized protein